MIKLKDTANISYANKKKSGSGLNRPAYNNSNPSNITSVGPSKNNDEKEKEKKRKSVLKLFALHANAKRKTTKRTIAKLFALHTNVKITRV